MSTCKTLRVYGVDKDVTQYSPVLQRFSAKTNEFARFDFQLLVAQTKLSDLCSCPLISFQELICVMKTKGHFLGNFPFLKKMMDCRQGLSTGTTQCALIITLFDNEAHIKKEEMTT